jgi:hypothetical protein
MKKVLFLQENYGTPFPFLLLFRIGELEFVDGLFPLPGDSLFDRLSVPEVVVELI